jgi:hypothetical protein
MVETPINGEEVVILLVLGGAVEVGVVVEASVVGVIVEAWDGVVCGVLVAGGVVVDFGVVVLAALVVPVPVAAPVPAPVPWRLKRASKANCGLADARDTKKAESIAKRTEMRHIERWSILRFVLAPKSCWSWSRGESDEMSRFVGKDGTSKRCGMIIIMAGRNCNMNWWLESRMKELELEW